MVSSNLTCQVRLKRMNIDGGEYVNSEKKGMPELHVKKEDEYRSNIEAEEDGQSMKRAA